MHVSKAMIETSKSAAQLFMYIISRFNNPQADWRYDSVFPTTRSFGAQETLRPIVDETFGVLRRFSIRHIPLPNRDEFPISLCILSVPSHYTVLHRVELHQLTDRLPTGLHPSKTGSLVHPPPQPAIVYYGDCRFPSYKSELNTPS